MIGGRNEEVEVEQESSGRNGSKKRREKEGDVVGSGKDGVGRGRAEGREERSARRKWEQEEKKEALVEKRRRKRRGELWEKGEKELNEASNGNHGWARHEAKRE